ncbi:MAG: mandelate racemase/muconate lactonizing enzyme family protein, partial [Anaerolineaceae bacterium]|nr:mandelate racemase/muconate lactonizing enzyme family protein [Anaerolineaceae bacterium]
MKIREVRSIPLFGWTDETGWDFKLDAAENQHTLIEIKTDEGVSGLGSVYTSQALVEGSLRILMPFVIGENALEPERVSEKLHQMTFWNGRGGAITHTISGIDIALWDILGKATGQPVGRLLGGYYRQKIKPYGSLLFDEAGKMRAALEQALQ